MNGDSGISVSAGSTLTVYATIPAGDYTNLTVKCGSSSKKISGKKSREAGHAYQITVEDPYKAVDLGLPSGLLWSKNNLGVETADFIGMHYAWGYTYGCHFDGANWRTTSNAGKNFTPANFPLNAYSNLSTENDAVIQQLGGKYRMPTKEEFEELISNTYQEWTEQNGVHGVLFTSKTDSSKKIFLPAAGKGSNASWSDFNTVGYYRSSTYINGGNFTAYVLKFNYEGSTLQTNVAYRSIATYNQGCSIRPVCTR